MSTTLTRRYHPFGLGLHSRDDTRSVVSPTPGPPVPTDYPSVGPLQTFPDHEPCLVTQTP